MPSYHDPDAITPYTPAAPVARRRNSTSPSAQTTQHVDTNQRARLEDYVTELCKLARKRGEWAFPWGKALSDFVSQQEASKIDWDSSLINIETAGVRMVRGEYFMTFDGKMNPEFTPRQIISLESQAVTLAKSRRPEHVNGYFMSDLAHNFLANLMLESGEVKDAVERLADCFLTYEAGGISSLACRTNNVKQTEQMQIWSKQVINLYKENRSFSDRLALTTFSKKLRWNLLVAASYVCCGQLPTATRVVKGDYDGILKSPPNVAEPGPGFVRHIHSLGRISHRYASLVGYAGLVSQEGGLEI